MAVRRLLFTTDDEISLIGDVIEYDEKIWLVPEWYEGPTPNTLCPARIVSLSGLSLAKAGPEYRADLVLATRLKRAVLEGRAVAQNLVVRERPDIFLRVDTDFHRG